MTIEIKIAVKPIIKKYLSFKIKTDPMVLSRTNAYGIFLSGCLVRLITPEKTKGGMNKFSLLGIDTVKYPEVLKVVISEDVWRRKGWYVHPLKQADFNKFIEKILMDEFHYYVDVHTMDRGEQIYSTFLKFRKKFDFTEEDFPIKTMEQNYLRYRITLNA